jgi:hypothetical protein
MKLRNFTLLAMTLLFIATAQAQTAGNGRTAAKTISASGCVTAGVEAGCLVVQDAKTKKLYNLYFAGGDKPELGTAIRFVGASHNGPTTCMQGEAIEVKSWKLVKKTCSTADAQKH